MRDSRGAEDALVAAALDTAEADPFDWLEAEASASEEEAATIAAHFLDS